MTRLFVDLDGVLADFEAGARASLGMSVRDFQELHGVPLLWRWLERTADFYERLPWTDDGRALWEGVTGGDVWTGPPPMILTGLPLGTWAEPQKRRWCARELGLGVPVMCCLSVDKRTYCCPGDILIDDRAEARPDWEEAGGIFIHHQSATESLAALAALLTPTPPEG